MTAPQSSGDKCPFVYCEARPARLREQGAPAPADGLHAMRIAQHAMAGEFDWWGPCPASLMTEPLGTQARALLEEVRQSIDRAKQRRDAVATDKPAQRSSGTGGHSLTPRPDAEPTWFKPSRGDTAGPAPVRHNPDGPGLLGAPPRPAAPPTPSTTPSTTGGGGMSSVAEVRAALSGINHRLGELQQVAQGLSGELAEVQATIEHTRQESVDPMGAPPVIAAIEAADTVSSLIIQATEDITTYMESGL